MWCSITWYCGTSTPLRVTSRESMPTIAPSTGGGLTTSVPFATWYGPISCGPKRNTYVFRPGSARCPPGGAVTLTSRARPSAAGAIRRNAATAARMRRAAVIRRECATARGGCPSTNATNVASIPYGGVETTFVASSPAAAARRRGASAAAFARDRLGGERAARAERVGRVGAGQARGEQAGGERVAGTGGVGHLHADRRRAHLGLAVGPERALRAELDRDLARVGGERAGGRLRVGHARQHRRLVAVRHEQVDAGDPLQERLRTTSLQRRRA